MELLLEWERALSYQTVRCWVVRFGPMVAHSLVHSPQCEHSDAEGFIVRNQLGLIGHPMVRRNLAEIVV
jgi:hypothetical protein